MIQRLRQASANAATMLNACRVSFTGKDFSHVQFREQIYRKRCWITPVFMGPTLQNVTLSKAFLRETDLTKADLTGVRFGEFPSMVCKVHSQLCCLQPRREIAGHWGRKND